MIPEIKPWWKEDAKYNYQELAKHFKLELKTELAMDREYRIREMGRYEFITLFDCPFYAGIDLRLHTPFYYPAQIQSISSKAGVQVSLDELLRDGFPAPLGCRYYFEEKIDPQWNKIYHLHFHGVINKIGLGLLEFLAAMGD